MKKRRDANHHHHHYVPLGDHSGGLGLTYLGYLCIAYTKTNIYVTSFIFIFFFWLLCLLSFVPAAKQTAYMTYTHNAVLYSVTG